MFTSIELSWVICENIRLSMTCKFSCKDQFGIVNYIINDHGRPQDDDDSRDPAAPPAHRRRLTKPQTSLGCSKCRYAANGCTECRLRFNLWQQRRGWHWVVRLKHVNFDCLGSWVTDSTGQNQCFQWNKQHFFISLMWWSSFIILLVFVHRLRHSA